VAGLSRRSYAAALIPPQHLMEPKLVIPNGVCEVRPLSLPSFQQEFLFRVAKSRLQFLQNLLRFPLRQIIHGFSHL